MLHALAGLLCAEQPSLRGLELGFCERSGGMQTREALKLIEQLVGRDRASFVRYVIGLRGSVLPYRDNGTLGATNGAAVGKLSFDAEPADRLRVCDGCCVPT